LSANFWTGETQTTDKWLGVADSSVKKVGLFGGSFNPIHYGHIGLAEYILKSTNIEQIWLMVSPQNPLKKRADLMDDNKRLYLAKEATKSKPNIKVCDIEMHLPIPSYTLNTLNILKEIYPTIEFSLIIGSDNVFCFNSWYGYKEILENTEIIVYPREGYDASELIKTHYPSMKLLAGVPTFNISSTEIREGEKTIDGDMVHP